MRLSSEVTMASDFPAKISGRTQYVDDLHLPGELYGGIVRSPHPYAKITRVDIREAQQVAGVKAVITGDNVPHHAYGPTVYKDWNILACEKVLFVGDEVVAIAADSRDALRQALDKVVVEYEALEPILNPHAALQPGAAVLHEAVPDNRPVKIEFERGDVDKAFAQAYIVRSGRYTTNRIYHGHLEPIAVIANWDEQDGLTLWAGSHIPYRARETYAAAFGLPEEKVRINVPPIGGSFGAKYVLKVHVIAAALSMRAGAPVRIALDRYEDMLTAHPRVPLEIDIRIAADKDGHFLGKDVVVYGDAGARIYWSPNVLASACTRADSLYQFHNVRAKGNLCYTNNSPTTCMRGFGNAEMLFAVENVIDEIAEGLGMDPAQLRLQNIVHKGDTTIGGYHLDSCELEACIRQVITLSGWARRRDFKKYHGLGMAIGNHVSGYRGIDPRFDGSTAVARLLASGRVEIETGEIDLGQGMSGTYAHIAARVLGIDPSFITVQSGDTGRYPFGIGTLASRSTVMGGNAVKQACERLRNELANWVKQHYGPTAVLTGGGVEVGQEQHALAEVARDFISCHGGDAFSVKETYTPATELPDRTLYGNPSPSYPFAAHVAEVEVDPDTFRVKVIGYWAVHDAGMVLNRPAATGQVVGGVAQGIGWVTMEDFKVSQGQVQNRSLLDYRMPGSSDVPPVTVEFLETEDPNGPFGAKSVGEMAIDPVPGAISNAIAHALGVRGHDLPLAPERLWRIMQEQPQV